MYAYRHLAQRHSGLHNLVSAKNRPGRPRRVNQAIGVPISRFSTSCPLGPQPVFRTQLQIRTSWTRRVPFGTISAKVGRCQPRATRLRMACGQSPGQASALHSWTARKILVRKLACSTEGSLWGLSLASLSGYWPNYSNSSVDRTRYSWRPPCRKSEPDQQESPCAALARLHGCSGCGIDGDASHPSTVADGRA